MKIYVASSWRNRWHPQVIEMLRTDGNEVYNFRESDGFHWSDVHGLTKRGQGDMVIDSTFAQYHDALNHPLARKGFARDMGALLDADICVMVLPCGRSAHLEAGYAMGDDKPTAVFVGEWDHQWELMYKMCDLVTDDARELLRWTRHPDLETVG